jgi:hypothetical protein
MLHHGMLHKLVLASQSVGWRACTLVLNFPFLAACGLQVLVTEVKA